MFLPPDSRPPEPEVTGLGVQTALNSTQWILSLTKPERVNWEFVSKEGMFVGCDAFWEIESDA